MDNLGWRRYRFWGYVFVFVCAIVLSACSAEADTTPTPDINAIVASTVEAQQRAFFMPTLQTPADGEQFADPSQVSLRWQWVRPLADDEFYDVRVWQDGDPDFGITWTSDIQFDLSQWLADRDAGEYLWSVAVIRGDNDSRTVDAIVGEPPPPRRFSVESNMLPTPTPDPTPDPITVESMLRTAPDGFTIDIAAHIEEAPTAITDIEFKPDGSLIAMAIDGRLYHLTDTDNDGLFDTTTQILSDELSFEWAIGMALYEDRIYISDQGRVGYVQDTDDDGRYDTYTNLTDELPGRIYPLHSNNGILIHDELVYIAVGSTTDHGPVAHPYEAAILTIGLDGGELEIFASGFRNPYDLTMSPDGRLFTGDNSPDGLGASLPFLPPEELNYVREGRHYGFPDVYGKNVVLNEVDYDVEPATTEFITSTATVGIAYYGANQFPANYHDGVFVAQFGGATPARNVLFVPLEETPDGNYRGEWQPFMQFIDGMQPVSLEVGPDGALYVVEWSFGRILRIRYTDDE